MELARKRSWYRIPPSVSYRVKRRVLDILYTQSFFISLLTPFLAEIAAIHLPKSCHGAASRRDRIGFAVYKYTPPKQNSSIKEEKTPRCDPGLSPRPLCEIPRKMTSAPKEPAHEKRLGARKKCESEDNHQTTMMTEINVQNIKLRSNFLYLLDFVAR